MHGNLKWFSDPEYSLYCDEGTWKTGYESLGVDIASVCVSKGKGPVTLRRIAPTYADV